MQGSILACIFAATSNSAPIRSFSARSSVICSMDAFKSTVILLKADANVPNSSFVFISICLSRLPSPNSATPEVSLRSGRLISRESKYAANARSTKKDTAIIVVNILFRVSIS
jgi:hypothetical protein